MSDSQGLIDPDKLRARRIRARMTAAELGRRVGVNRSFIPNVERRVCNVSPATLGALADVLGCDIDDLMPDEQPAPARTRAERKVAA